MEALRVLPPTHLIGAVEALPIIERFSARMADRGALYNVDEDVYFAKSADYGFGSLSGPGTACGYDPGEMAELAAQRGGDPDRPGKKDPLDVLVWRAERPGEPAWTPGSGAAGPAGTSSARRSPPNTWATPSTSRPAVLTWYSRTTR